MFVSLRHVWVAMLELNNVSKRVGDDDHISDISLTFDRGSINVLLGPTLQCRTQKHVNGTTIECKRNITDVIIVSDTLTDIIQLKHCNPHMPERHKHVSGIISSRKIYSETLWSGQIKVNV